MNKGLEIVLKRMDSHPEEFEFSSIFNHGGIKGEDDVTWELRQRRSHWERLIQLLITRGAQNPSRPDTTVPYPTPPIVNTAFLGDEEVATVLNKFYGLQGDRFTGEVMQTLLAEPEPRQMQGAQPGVMQGLGYQNSLTGLAQAQNDLYAQTADSKMRAMKAGQITFGPPDKSTIVDWLVGS